MSPATAIALGPARRPRRARPRRPVDPLRGPRALLAEIAALDAVDATRAHAGDLRRADQARAGRRAAQGDPRRRGDGRRRADPAAHPGALAGRSSTPASTCSSSAARRSAPSTSAASAEPLNLKRFIYELDVPVIVGGCATYTAALHLMRTGAAGVLVGFGGGAAHTTRTTLGIHAPMATAVADVAAARRDYMDESGGRYVHVIADGGMGTVRRHRQGDRLRRRRRHARRRAGPRRRGSRARLPLGARGAPPAAAARRARATSARSAPLAEILLGPAPDAPTARRTWWGPAPRDGDDRILRPQGVPAGRGRRLALTARADAAHGRPGGPRRGRTWPRLHGMPQRRTAADGSARRSAQRRSPPGRGQTLDVVVVGGGVVGAGAALDAVDPRALGRRWSRLATGPAARARRSSKLVHGGLRYLEMLDFGLVREALHERGLLLHRLAPHLVRPVPFLYPLKHRVLGAAVRRRRPDALRHHGVGPAGNRRACPGTGTCRASAGAAGGARACAPTPSSGRCSTTTPRSTTPGTR